MRTPAAVRRDHIQTSPVRTFQQVPPSQALTELGARSGVNKLATSAAREQGVMGRFTVRTPGN